MGTPFSFISFPLPPSFSSKGPDILHESSEAQQALWYVTAVLQQGQKWEACSFRSELRVSYFSSSFTFQACPGSSQKLSKMEPLTTSYPLKYSVPKARVFVVFLSMVLCATILCLLQLRFFKPKTKDFYSFEVKDSRGRIISLEKYRGKVSYYFTFLSWILTDKKMCTFLGKQKIWLWEFLAEICAKFLLFIQ